MTAPVRPVSRGLAGILAELELTQPTVISLADVAALAARAGLKTSPSVVADRLRRRGWLLPTGQRGMYEFAPGAHAGPYGHGDPFLTFRAARAVRSFDAAIALQSALWLDGLSDRAPNKHELAAAPGAAVPESVMREMRVVRFSARLEPDLINGLPVHQAASILVHLATKPSSVKNWSVFTDALADLVALTARADEDTKATKQIQMETTTNNSTKKRSVSRTAGDRLRAELQGRSDATTTRLAYLLSGVAPAIADQLQPRPAAGVVYFGPRRSSRRFNSRFNIADTVLPFDPAELRPRDEAR
jgi:hypothetical protein